MKMSLIRALLCAGMLGPLAAQAATPLPVASYTLSVNGPNYYGYDDAGSDLTDGVMDVAVGGGYWNWSPYVLWDNVSPTITFDLGATKSVDRLEAHFLTYPVAAVYLPTAATVRYSNDRSSFTPAQVVNDISAGPFLNDQPITLSFLTPGTGRFVELTLTTPGRWIALSEVQLLSAVPEPASTTLALMGGALLAFRMRRRVGAPRL